MGDLIVIRLLAIGVDTCASIFSTGTYCGDPVDEAFGGSATGVFCNTGEACIIVVFSAVFFMETLKSPLSTSTSETPDSDTSLMSSLISFNSISIKLRIQMYKN